MSGDVLSTSRNVVSITALTAAASVASQRASTNKAQTTTELWETFRDVCGKPNTTSLLLAAGLNAAVLGYVAFKLYRSASVQHEKYLQLKASAQRLWRLATQGADAAGPVPEDLGEPDASGVYTKQSVTGTLYFRRARQHGSGALQWEWSTDRTFWIPTCHADSLWYNADSSPSQADKVLIRRLEVEGHLLGRQHGSSGGGAATGAAGGMLPPLDLSQATRDVSCLADIPTAFLCPISMRLMTQPVVTPSGATFDRPALLDWIRQTYTDPLSGQPLSSDQLVPNLVLRDMIHAWLHEDAGDSNGSSSSSNSGGGGNADSSSGSAVHVTTTGSSSKLSDLAAVAAAGGSGADELHGSNDSLGTRDVPVLPSTPR